MSTDIALRHEDLVDLKELGAMLIESGMFKDVRDVAQAVVKVQAGRELGLGPVESMRAFHVIEGKVEASADLLATLVKRHPRYDYRVKELMDDVCTLEFLQDGESIGLSRFTMEDAYKAGLGRKGPWLTYARNMLFARAMSNGVAWFCPDVTSGARIFVEGEAGGAEEAPSMTWTSSDPPASIIEIGTVAEPESSPIPGAPAAAPEAAAPEPSEEGRASAPFEGGPLATAAQMRKLMVLAMRMGWDDEQRRAEAGVASFTELTKQRASELIEVWETFEKPGAEAAPEPEGSSVDPGGGLEEPEGSGVDLASPEQWSTALHHYPNANAVLKAARQMFPDEAPASKAEVTKAMLAQVIIAGMNRS